MMYDEVVSTTEAAKILGCGRAMIIKMIHDRTIKTAYMASPDGYVGRPGYRISVDEINELVRLKEEARTNREGTERS